MNVRYYAPYCAYNVISIAQGEPPELVESMTDVHTYILAGFFEFIHVHMYVWENQCTEDLFYGYIFYGTVLYGRNCTVPC